MWAYTLLLPTVLRSLPAEYSTLYRTAFSISGPMGINWLRPEALLGFESFAALHPWGGVGTGSEYPVLYMSGFLEFSAPAWPNKFKQKAFFYYETKPLTNAEHQLYRHQLHSSRCCTL